MPRVLPVAAALLGACILGAVHAADSTRPGLAGVFFNSPRVAGAGVASVDPQIQIDTGTSLNDYSRYWTGYLTAPVTGEVTFFAEADDGLRLTLGGTPVIDGWGKDQAREGRLKMKAGQRVPLQLAYFQDGGTAHLRLYWSYPGQSRQLIPPSAFSHGSRELEEIRQIAAAEKSAEWRTNRSALYGITPSARADGPIELPAGPHLFLDDHLIASSTGVARVVNRPRRDASIPNPLITGERDAVFQPYLSVIRDPDRGTFRIWYGAYTKEKSQSASHLATMESRDGIHWQRPHRILPDPAPIQFGVSVLDEGKRVPNPAQRFKYAWWHGGGMKVAASGDGLNFAPLFDNRVVLPHNHDINGIFWDPVRKHYVAMASTMEPGPTWRSTRRVTLQSVSSDLSKWRTPWYVLTPVDRVEPGEVQFYAMDGFLARGGLLIGMVKVLRDDLTADNPPDSPDQTGVGYTSLAWSRDGVTWVRDREHFFDPDPQKGTWDHAHAWIDEQLPVGDQVYLYYGGYARGHKVNRFAERQIGLVRMPRDRYVAREAGEKAGTLRTPVVIPRAGRMTLNVAAPQGEVRVQVTDAAGRPLPGFSLADCRPTRGDSLAAPVRWKGRLADLRGKPVRLEFRLRRAKLFAFDLQ